MVKANIAKAKDVISTEESLPGSSTSGHSERFARFAEDRSEDFLVAAEAMLDDWRGCRVGS